MTVKTLSLGILMGLVLAVAPAGAVTITTEASYDVVHATTGAANDTAGPSTATTGNLYDEVNYLSRPWGHPDGFPSEIMAGSVANVNGQLAGGAFMYFEDDMSSMAYHGLSTWSDTITNTSGGASTYSFDFNVTDAALGIYGPGASTMFRMDVLLNGTSLWDVTASLSSEPGGGTPLIEAGGLSHSAYGSGDYLDVVFDSFSVSVALGTFGSGDAFELTYSLEFWGTTTEDYSFARVAVGDPFFAGFLGTVNSSTSAPVPEPATMVLLGMGIVGLGARRLRKSS